jgi:hypothetical protein
VLNEKVIENPVIENQEVYRLWYDYLKANKDYERLCKEIREALKLSKKEQASFPCGNWEYSQVINFAKVYSYWGDVHVIAWEDKLSEISRKIAQVETNDDPSLKIVEQDKLSSLCEFTSLKEAYITIPQNYFSLLIPYGVPIDKLMEQLREIVLKKIEGRPDKRPLFPLPSRKLSEGDIKNLRRYLEVYRLMEIEKLTREEVSKKIDPDKKIHKGNDPSVWSRENRSAKDIIENAGKNIFPGEYGQNIKKGEKKKVTTKNRKR